MKSSLLNMQIVREIHCEANMLELRTEIEVLVLRTWKGRPAVADDLNVNKKKPINRTRKNKRSKNDFSYDKHEIKNSPASNKIRVAEQSILQLHSEDAINRRKAIEQKPKISSEQLVSTTNDVAHVQSNVPFALLIEKFAAHNSEFTRAKQSRMRSPIHCTLREHQSRSPTCCS